MRSWLRFGAALSSFFLVPWQAAAQAVRTPGSEHLARGHGPAVVDGMAPASTLRGQETRSRELRDALASALVPGAGQFLQGRRRWIAYVAAEAVAWGVHLEARSDGRKLRTRYRDLAWSAARGSPTPRVDGDFEYYERLGRWNRSGSFDVEPATPGVQPERDPSSYNGAQWELAADIYLLGESDAQPGTPGYEEALEYYRERAYPEKLTWSWEEAPEARSRFLSLIDESNGRFQVASLALGAVVANHLLSATDAFVSARLGPEARIRLAPGGVGPRSPGMMLRLQLTIR